MADILGFAGIGTCFVSLIFAVISIALKTWIYKDEGGTEVIVGLWGYCAGDSCEDIDFDTLTSSEVDSFRAVRAMMIIGIVLLPGAIVCVILKMFVLKDKDILSLIAGAVAGFAGLCLMVAMAIFADKLYGDRFKDDNFDLSSGFALDIVAWIVAWIAAGILIASKFVGK